MRVASEYDVNDQAATLFKKLRIKPGTRLLVQHAPREYDQMLKHLPHGVERVTRSRGDLDVIHTFVNDKRTALADVPKLAKALKKDGILWVSYPKTKSVPTDVNRDVLREELEKVGLEAVAIVAVDALWSALRFKVQS